MNRRNDPYRMFAFLLLSFLSGLLAACTPNTSPPQVRPDPPIPQDAAVAIVNQNLKGINGALRALGTVDIAFRDEKGRLRRFTLDGVLFFLDPQFLRFDLKKLGERQLLVGSNSSHYWSFIRDEDRWLCHEHDALGPPPEGLPIHPADVIESLGLSRIPENGIQRGYLYSQRIVDEHQQILFIESTRVGPRLTKEYWLDRYPPRLIRKVIFRDVDGVIALESNLGPYRRFGDDGPALPERIVARWPQADARMEFRIRQWRTFPQLGPDAVQFATPDACNSVPD